MKSVHLWNLMQKIVVIKKRLKWARQRDLFRLSWLKGIVPFFCSFTLPSHSQWLSFHVFVDNATVADLCENHLETLRTICIKLEDKHFVNNWQNLGIEIGMKGTQLRKFNNPSEYSPADVVLRKIETLKPDLLLTDMKRGLGGLNLEPGLADAIANVLNDFRGKHLLIKRSENE